MKKISLLIALTVCSYNASAAIQLMATRVVYNSSNSSAALPIENQSNSDYLVQTWLEDPNGGTTNIPMQVVPPILKLNAGKSASLRFIYSGKSLPDNQESLFWVNIQEIPPASKDQNILQVAVHSRLKLFYRPSSLKTTLAEQAENLKWVKSGNQLNIKNNGPMYISLNTLHIENKNINLDMVAPFGEKTINLGSSNIGNTISYGYINDFGGVTEIKNHPLN